MGRCTSPRDRWKRQSLIQSAFEALGAALCVLVGSSGGLHSNLKDPDDAPGDAAAGHRTLFVLLAQHHGPDRVRRWFDNAYRYAIRLPSLSLFVLALAGRHPVDLILVECL